MFCVIGRHFVLLGFIRKSGLVHAGTGVDLLRTKIAASPACWLQVLRY